MGELMVRRSAGSNTYCGPAALSVITGLHVDECVQRIQILRGSAAKIRGVYTSEMISVLLRTGFRPTRIPLKDHYKPTVAQFLRLFRDRKPEDVYLINVTGHYIVLRGRKIVDNVHEPTFVRQWPHRRARVHKVWRIDKEPK